MDFIKILLFFYNFGFRTFRSSAAQAGTECAGEEAEVPGTTTAQEGTGGGDAEEIPGTIKAKPDDAA